MCNILDQGNSIFKGANGVYLACLRKSGRPVWLKMSKPGEMKSEREAVISNLDEVYSETTERF